MKKKTFLMFYIRGEYFVADEKGNIIQYERFKPSFTNVRLTKRTKPDFSGQWKLLGVSTHHRHCRCTVSFEEIWKDPKLMVNGYLWDRDHGTLRQWGGCYEGKVPRVTLAYLFDAEVPE